MGLDPSKEKNKKEKEVINPFSTLQKKFYPTLNKPSSLLNDETVKRINENLPKREKNLNWIKLFSNEQDGQNFSLFSKALVNRGPTIIIIKTKGSLGHIFGCFSSKSWKENPGFFGDAATFLFTLNKRNEIVVYRPSHYNTNFQYFNAKEGIGIGGRLGYFALHISSDLMKTKSIPKTVTFPSCPNICDAKSSCSEEIEKGIDFEYNIDIIEVYSFPLSEKQKLELNYYLTLKEGKQKNVLEDNPDYFLLQTAGVIKEKEERD